MGLGGFFVQQYREGYEVCLENKRVEWNEESNVEYMGGVREMGNG